ncbi:hypothetical protein GGR56DRAFT_23967 [Xylariaceae sp. FL0804]|nr:hypothetical protein GGR56DRAFT_23967 [Xylariaceae sp. FL0804]
MRGEKTWSRAGARAYRTVSRRSRGQWRRPSLSGAHHTSHLQRMRWTMRRLCPPSRRAVQVFSSCSRLQSLMSETRAAHGCAWPATDECPQTGSEPTADEGSGQSHPIGGRFHYSCASECCPREARTEDRGWLPCHRRLPTGGPYGKQRRSRSVSYDSRR